VAPLKTTLAIAQRFAATNPPKNFAMTRIGNHIVHPTLTVVAHAAKEWRNAVPKETTQDGAAQFVAI